MTPLDAAGHVGYVLLFAGQVCIARGRRVGWLVRIGGELTWLWIGWQMGLSSVVLWGVVALGVEAYGWSRGGAIVERKAVQAAESGTEVPA